MIAAGLVLAGVTTVVSQRHGGTLADAHRSQWLGYAIIALEGAAILAVVAALNTQDRFAWVPAAFLLFTGGRQLSRWWVARQSS